MYKTRILIFGESHVDAIKRALKQQVDDEKFQIEAYRYVRIKNGKKIGDLTEKEILQLVTSLRKTDMVVSMIGGNQHQTFSLIQHPIKFDIHMPNQGNNIDTKESIIIPYAQVWDTFENGLNGKDGVRIQALAKISPCPIYHLTPPPPKQDEKHILKKHETHFMENNLEQLGISNAQLRAKIWILQCEVLEYLTKAWNVELIYPPKKVVIEGKFLQPEYYADDATHANTKYGKIILKHLKAIASKHLENGDRI